MYCTNNIQILVLIYTKFICFNIIYIYTLLKGIILLFVQDVCVILKIKCFENGLMCNVFNY